MKRISLSDPEKSSLGYYAKKGLQKLGLWESIQQKLIVTPSWMEGYKAVLNEEVDAAFAFFKCPIRGGGELQQKAAKWKIVQELLEATIGPIVCKMNILAKTLQPKIAKKFVDFALSPKIQRKLPEYDLSCLLEERKK